MIIHCLGTTGYHPSPSRHTACYYLPELALMFDCGSGMFRLTEHLLREPKESLDILLSHAHLDHVFGLSFLLDITAVTSLDTVRLWGRKSKLDAVREHLFHTELFPLLPPIEFHPLDKPAGTIQLSNCSVEYFPLEHPGGSTGFVVSTKEKRFAYITDTVGSANADYCSRIENLDLLMHECYFGDDQIELSKQTGHTWLSGVEDVVHRVKPKRTVLIHINPLAEILKSELPLTKKHASQKISLAKDEEIVEF